MLGFLVAVAVTASVAAPLSRLDPAPSGWPIGDFVLTDQRGRPFTDEDLQGRWTFLLFVGTRCLGDSDGALSALAGMQRRIARTEAVKEAQVVLVFLDSPIEAADADPDPATYDPWFIGVNAKPESLAGLPEDLGVSDPETLSGGSGGECGNPGSEFIWLIGPDAVVRGRFSPPFDLLLLTSDFLRARLKG